MDEVGVDAFARRTLSALKLNFGRLARVADFVRAARRVMLTRAIGGGARLATQVVLQIDNVAFDVRHGGTTDNAKFHAALVAVFKFDGVQGVRERARALVQLFLVRTCIVDEAI